MFRRNILNNLQKWMVKNDRKPLVIRGARQVGKTTAIKQFSSQFDRFMYFNLELAEDKQPFLQFDNVTELLRALFFLRNIERSESEKILIFIDEIQEVPKALNILRYFYEQVPEIFVIAAGSLLETLFDNKVRFPVGRVEFMVVRPVSFPEFLEAMNEKEALKQLEQVPVADFAHEKLLKLFHTYALIGGMPEIIDNYSQNKDLTALNPIYESLIASYIDDVEKYASNENQVQIIRHAIKSSYIEAGKRIKFQGFGSSNYSSREMGEALRTLEKALLIYLIYPNSSTTLPLIPNLRKSPRLHVLDTGMLNYFAGIQQDVLLSEELSGIYKGTLIEHWVGQELLAFQYNALSHLNFWVREKKTSMAEVDYLYSYKSKLIPIEVKSAVSGKLKSLHLFMDKVPHDIAIRFYGGKLSISDVETGNGKKFQLLNLPYYLVSQIENYLDWDQLMKK